MRRAVLALHGAIFLAGITSSMRYL